MLPVPRFVIASAPPRSGAPVPFPALVVVPHHFKSWSAVPAPPASAERRPTRPRHPRGRPPRQRRGVASSGRPEVVAAAASRGGGWPPLHTGCRRCQAPVAAVYPIASCQLHPTGRPLLRRLPNVDPRSLADERWRCRRRANTGGGPPDRNPPGRLASGPATHPPKRPPCCGRSWGSPRPCQPLRSRRERPSGLAPAGWTPPSRHTPHRATAAAGGIGPSRSSPDESTQRGRPTRAAGPPNPSAAARRRPAGSTPSRTDFFF